MQNQLTSFSLLLIPMALSGCFSSNHQTQIYKEPVKHPRFQTTAQQQDEVKQPKEATRASCESPYKVQYGDTLSGIAAKCKINMQILAQANNLYPPYWLKSGQYLQLPNSISSQKTTQITEHQSNKVKTTLNWLWPTSPEYPYEFVSDAQGNHSLSIRLPKGKEIKSVADGEVVYADNAVKHYGFMVVIRHASDYLTVYAYNQLLAVNKGQKVKKGQLIAYSGQTGQAEKPMLYFETRYRGRKIDSMPLLKTPRAKAEN